MKTVSIALFALATLGTFAFALKLLLAKTYFPYHQQVTGKAWQDLDPGVRTVIGAFMRLFGGALMAAAGTTAWMLWLYATGVAIPAPLVALPGLVIGLVTLGVTTTLFASGGTKAPRGQVAILVGITIVAVIAGLLAN
ncbi:hypothetical protein [Oricola indica]|jgi:hypothetical protein|uniref:hypothetical protein n=1 Tax=Oricola indica TaxID=2872591 RepID=UPI001CBAD336|nr:hypothetical protein [Oricola indica]